MEGHFIFYEFFVLNFWGINGELSAPKVLRIKKFSLFIFYFDFKILFPSHPLSFYLFSFSHLSNIPSSPPIYCRIYLQY